MHTALKIAFRLIGGVFRWLITGLTAWYRDGQTRMDGERAARWDMRDRVERWWSVCFFALLLLWGSATDLTLPFIEDSTWAAYTGIGVLTLGGIFVSIILARRIVVSVTHDPWTAQEMWTDRVHLSAIAFVAITTPVVMLVPAPVVPQEWVVAGLPLVTGLISGAWATSVILVDHRMKEMLLSSVRAAFGGSEAEWSRARFSTSFSLGKKLDEPEPTPTPTVESDEAEDGTPKPKVRKPKVKRAPVSRIVTIRHAPASAFADLRASEAKLMSVAPDWQIEEGDATSPTASRLTLIRTKDDTRNAREIMKRSEGLVVGVTDVADTPTRPKARGYILAPGTTPSAYPRADALARSEGCRVVVWEPEARNAIVADLDSRTAALRDAFAGYLPGAHPYDIEIAVEYDENERPNDITVIRYPRTDPDARKREQTWLAILDAESVRDENEVWLLDEDGTTMVWKLRTDPLAAIQLYPWDAKPTVDAIPFGVDDHGAPVTLKLYESNVLVGGLPGSGKSGGSTAILAGVSRLPHTAIYGIDLKRVELSLWAPRFEEVAKDTESAHDLLTRLNTEMDARYLWLDERKLKKLSFATFSDATPFIVLIIDELAKLMMSGDKSLVDDIKVLLRDLVQMGRAAGIAVVTMTQKPQTSVVPSEFRDLLAQRVAFATATRQMTDTILGDGIEGGEAHTIAQSLKGVNFLTNEESRVPRRTRAYWIPDEEVEGIAERTAHLRVGVKLADPNDDTLPDNFPEETTEPHIGGAVEFSLGDIDPRSVAPVDPFADDDFDLENA